MPVIVYTGKELTRDEEQELKRHARSVITKSGSHSVERLLSDAALFLHRVHQPSQVPQVAQVTEPAPAQLASPEPRAAVSGKKVLVVDDDIRNIYAITSLLESHEMQVVHAENGKAGIAALKENPDIDVVLMDIMMPGMDGYETMRTIRKDPAYQALPIIAITAKAMKDDRAKCIDAGANDYLPSPSTHRSWSR